MFEAFLEATFLIQLSIVAAIIWKSFFLSRAFKKFGWIYLVLAFAPYVFIWIRTGEMLDLSTYTSLIVLPSIPIALVILFFTWKPEKKLEDTTYIVNIETENNGIFPIDLRRHLAVFGASGSGKTDSGFAPIMKHLTEKNISTLLYDYKEFELTIKILYFYQLARQHQQMIPFKLVAPGDPNFSDFINPVAPRYMDSMETMETTSKTLFDNLYPSSSDNESIWKDMGAAAFSGTVWRLKEDFPELCSLPYAIAIMLSFTGYELVEFIKVNQKAAILAAPFVDSAGNEKQLASAKSSLSAAIKKLATPNLFMVFSEDSFDLVINKPDNANFVSFVNMPSRAPVYSPVLAMTTKVMLDLMSKPGRQDTVLLLDEASTFKLPGLDTLVATLRTFNVRLVWGLQDKIQGEILYDIKILKSIISNLTTKIIGKANDPDTSNWYTQLIETIDVEQRSYSMKDTSLNSGDKRVSVSTKEEAKYKSFDFQRLRPGEFVILNDKAEDMRDRLKMPVDFRTLEEEGKLPKPEKKHNLSEAEIDEFFTSVFDRIDELRPEIPEDDY